MGFCASLLKISAKGTPEAMAKFLEIQALFEFLCIVASCWLSMKTNLRRRLCRNFISRYLYVGFVHSSSAFQLGRAIETKRNKMRPKEFNSNFNCNHRNSMKGKYNLTIGRIC